MHRRTVASLQCQDDTLLFHFCMLSENKLTKFKIIKVIGFAELFYPILTNWNTFDFFFFTFLQDDAVPRLGLFS